MLNQTIYSSLSLVGSRSQGQNKSMQKSININDRVLLWLINTNNAVLCTDRITMRMALVSLIHKLYAVAGYATHWRIGAGVSLVSTIFLDACDNMSNIVTLCHTDALVNMQSSTISSTNSPKSLILHGGTLGSQPSTIGQDKHALAKWEAYPKIFDLETSDSPRQQISHTNRRLANASQHKT